MRLKLSRIELTLLSTDLMDLRTTGEHTGIATSISTRMCKPKSTLSTNMECLHGFEVYTLNAC